MSVKKQISAAVVGKQMATSFNEAVPSMIRALRDLGIHSESEAVYFALLDLQTFSFHRAIASDRLLAVYKHKVLNSILSEFLAFAVSSQPYAKLTNGAGVTIKVPAAFYKAKRLVRLWQDSSNSRGAPECRVAEEILWEMGVEDPKVRPAAVKYLSDLMAEDTVRVFNILVRIGKQFSVT